jgi:cytolysin (calcineurin-like family phosphatase)
MHYVIIGESRSSSKFTWPVHGTSLEMLKFCFSYDVASLTLTALNSRLFLQRKVSPDHVKWNFPMKRIDIFSNSAEVIQFIFMS